ncbi:uncharacterized protein LDX57_011772 [Aspergillus melleus]|uniref:uncharacterized protein n=1 Tax=Aspergillus melleus TaxID=138277 RepID=UPI001E8E35E0|nr:uncharacterized protein LDX57_011772 [Aspergillus melleus]KAH8434134.1 hypothetical protein LDX57_011772 [Aspergillus melleus]
MLPFVPHPLPIPVDSPFPVSNIPFGIFSTLKKPQPRPGVAVGEHVLDLCALAAQGHIQGSEQMRRALCQPTLNDFAALPGHERAAVRRSIQELITTRGSPLYDEQGQSKYLVQSADVNLHLPMTIGGFTDFSCSLVHMRNAGRIAGHPQLPANFFNVPPAYNGRASSVVVSGTPIHRPYGIRPDSHDDHIAFGLSQKLDYEVELGMFVSNSIPLGQRISASKAKDHIFGFVLLNDWTARDIQFYEMTPLGPFNGKAFATSISPWIVTLEALQEAGAIIPVDKDGLQDELQGGKASTIPFLQAKEDVSAEVLTFLDSM